MNHDHDLDAYIDGLAAETVWEDDEHQSAVLGTVAASLHAACGFCCQPITAGLGGAGAQWHTSSRDKFDVTEVS